MPHTTSAAAKISSVRPTIFISSLRECGLGNVAVGGTLATQRHEDIATDRCNDPLPVEGQVYADDHHRYVGREFVDLTPRATTSRCDTERPHHRFRDHEAGEDRD